MENKNIIYYKQLDSTNTKIDELAAEGAKHGTVVVADAQSAGKGRRGRSWESPAGDNIYMSVLLRPELKPEEAPMLTMVMAHSVAKAIKGRVNLDVQIKWPNDLILSGKKVCGILTEMRLKGTAIDYITVGVGVNVNTKIFPEELCDKASSLYLECGEETERKILIEDIVTIFWEEYAQFMTERNLSFLLDEYNAMLINREKEVRVLEPGNEYTAYAIGMTQTGELLVTTEDGKEKQIYAGEVSVRGVYGYV